MENAIPTTNDSHPVFPWSEIFQGSSPCGEDLSRDPDFEALQDEIGKNTSIHDGQKTDWNTVYALADSVLARSKDLWAYAYGIIAIYHTKNATDCAFAVTALAHLAASQWASLHPSLQRPQRRVAPLKWLYNKLTHLAETTAFLGVSPTSLAALTDALAALQNAIDAQLPGNDLAFGNILRAKIVFSAQAEQTQQQKTSAGADGAKPAPVNSAGDTAEKSPVIPPSTLPQVIRAANDYCRQLGDHLLAINGTYEPGFLLHRVQLWYTLPQLPPANADGLTQMTCPVVPDMIDMFTAAVNDKRYSEILPQLEKAAGRAPFWLDGHYLVVRCLEETGAAETACSVKHALAQLLRRFPEITALKFKDGRPFASPKTAVWLESFTKTMFSENFSPAGEIDAFPAIAQDNANEMLQNALAKKDEKGFNSGLACLGTVQPGKSRAFIKHCMIRARYCMAAGHTLPAIMLLDTVFDKLKKWDLLEWEPELTSEAILLRMSLKSHRHKQDDELASVLHEINLEAAISSIKS